MFDKGKQNILGVLVSAVDSETAVARVIAAAVERAPLAVSAMAVHGIMTGYLDSEHKHRLNSFDMILPDGQPVKWAIEWLHGIDLPNRVYGPMLMIETCAEAERLAFPIFLYGSTEEVLRKLSIRLRQKFPSLQIAGTMGSRFRRLSTQEKGDVISYIRNSGARVVFVGLGCPRQEIWAYEFRNALSLPVVTVGGAFSVHAGVSSQAPKWMQNRGLEWVFRLVAEPGRLWKRYLLLNPLFLGALGLQMLGLRFDTSGREPQVEALHG